MAALDAGIDFEADVRGEPLWRRGLRRASITVGATLLIIIVFAALVGPWLIITDPYFSDLSKRLINPIWHPNGTWQHPLGTDGFGRDYLARLIYGARISLAVGIISTILSGVIGTALGLVAGYFGGRIDAVVNFVIMTRLSMPVVLIATAVSSHLSGSFLSVTIVIGCLIWDRFAVVVRSATLQIRQLDYVKAARAIGASTSRILLRELLPNLFHFIVVVAAIEMAHAIIIEAALSFLGLGIQPPTPSWGLMIAEGKALMMFKPWVIMIPGTALFVLILAVSLLGDGLRDLMSSEVRR